MPRDRCSDKGVILVTGSSGRIGAAVCKRMGKNFDIVGFELLKALYASANEELVPCDISSDESVAQALAHIRNFYGNRITSVIHLAAYYSFSQQHLELYDKITVEGTRRLLKGLQSFHVEQFIFSSTMLVHQPTVPGKKITEETPLKPKWAYPASKVKTEKVIHEERGEIPTVILRISGVYDDDCHSIPISNQIQRIYEGQFNAHVFSGDVTHGSSFMHMEDLTNAIENAIHKRNELPKEITLLLGESSVLSYDQMQRQISQLLFNKEFSTHIFPKPLAKFGAWVENHIPLSKNSFIQPWMIDLADDHYDLDISKAEKFLKWIPKHSLEKTLPIIIADLKQDPVAWYKKNGLKMPESILKKAGTTHK
ncbi:MAG: NAD(P)-dependent oxidoreductase [Chlamydiia bacterium]|nr:NAD(P)-dependent oxidoreductase [Chlamydiia bacterium]